MKRRVEERAFAARGHACVHLEVIAVSTDAVRVKRINFIFKCRGAAEAMPPKNRRSAAFSKVHKCHARPAAQMKATRRLSTARLVVEIRRVVLSELRRSHFLRAIGVVSSSAIAATS